MLEVELKASLLDADRTELVNAIKMQGFVFEKELLETDIYFNGNDRDFRKTDEALRLRSARLLTASKETSQQEAALEPAASTFLTYKGPKQDETSQTRRELEAAVGDLTVTRNLLEALGYQALFTVEKTRRQYLRGDITICLDQVKGLGDFIELETLLENQLTKDGDISGNASPEAHQKEAAVSRLLLLLDSLSIPRKNLTQKSYLELLIASMTS